MNQETGHRINIESDNSESESEEDRPQTMPNRYHTTVSLEFYEESTLRRVYWFSDFQEAYLFVKKYTEERPLLQWRTASFENRCERMDRQWQINQEGVLLASCGQYRFRACYEPDAQRSNHN